MRASRYGSVLIRLIFGICFFVVQIALITGIVTTFRDSKLLVLICLRNFGKLIHIADTEQVRNYVIKHYGPLDFNLSDGQAEQSIVVD